MVKTLSRKLLLIFFCFAVLVAGFVYYFYLVDVNKVDLNVFAASVLLLVVLFAVTCFFLVSKPLKTIVREIEALITGRRFHKIYTRRTDELGVIANFFNDVTGNLKSLTENIKDQKRLTDELALASELQKNILPPSAPVVDGLMIVVKTKSAAETGGDSFDFIDVGDKTYMYVGDVTGHGVPAALVMTMVHALVRVFSETAKSTFELIVQTNKHLKQHISSTMFMTMVMLCWDKVNKKLTFVGAGHEYLFVFRSKTGACEQIKTGGIALGMVLDNSKLVKETALDLEDGDFVLLFTDGVVEARSESGEMYGFERLKKRFAQFAVQYGPADVHKQIALDFSQFVGSHVQEDDITLMVLQRKDDAVISHEQEKSTHW